MFIELKFRSKAAYSGHSLYKKREFPTKNLLFAVHFWVWKVKDSQEKTLDISEFLTFEAQKILLFSLENFWD